MLTIKRDGTFHQQFPAALRKIRTEPFHRSEYGFVTVRTPFFPEMLVLPSEHNFTFFLAPCVPHIVEEAGDCISRLIFHDFQI